MKILFLGDIVGKTGRQAVEKILPDLKKEHQPDVVIANAENLAHGDGINLKTLEQMEKAGIDYFTSGNHAFKKAKDLEIWEKANLIRPLNMPDHPQVPGKGALEMKVAGEKVWLVNLQGLIFMSEYLPSPFDKMEGFLKAHPQETIIVDFHQEATSEIQAFGQHFDGRLAVVLGTHTHVQTADERVLEDGTGYITDVGMCGSLNSVIGVKKEEVIRHFQTGLKFKLEPGDFPAIVNGVVIKLDPASRKALSIKRINQVVEE